MDSDEIPAQAETALLEGGLQIWGDVRFRGDGVLHAKVDGQVTGRGKITVTMEAEVSGAVEAEHVRIEGIVAGEVMGRGLVWLGSKAKVIAKCTGRTVRIEPGAQFRGELQVG